MKHLDLFSGIGGFALACDWAGIETIGFVEIDKYCQKVLRKHWPNVPIVEDIRDVKAIKEIVAHAKDIHGSWGTEGCSESQPVKPGGVSISPGRRSSSPTGEPIITDVLVTAGFPCQPFSVAGKRGGDTDDRYLWPQTLAVIEAVKPKWVLLENVAGIIPMALDDVLSDLEGAGYAYETLVIPACAVNAPHRRDRIWIVAHNEQSTCRRGQGSGRGSKEDAADTQRERLEGADTEGDSRRGRQPGEYEQWRWQADWWATQSQLCRVAHGIPHRVDRLKCLGNAIVPQVALELIKVIQEVENAQV